MNMKPALAENAMSNCTASTDWRRPVPDNWCYTCGHTATGICDEGYCIQRPQILADVVFPVAEDACSDGLACPVLLSDWAPGHIESARALAARITSWADAAESIAARASA